jgi:dienelactone hydrolase
MVACRPPVNLCENRARPTRQHLYMEGETTMRISSTIVSTLALLLAAQATLAQPPGITMEMVNTTLPEEGAPLAVPGSYSTTGEAAFGAPRYVLHRPAALDAFPARDKMPVVVWGNGGCAIANERIGGFLGTIASHGFLVITTTSLEGEERRSQTADDLRGAIDWAFAENARAGSLLQGKVDTSQVAVMGQSCGGMLSISLGTDPRVKTIGVLNSGVQAPGGNADPTRATTDDLPKLHGPALFINGHDRDFLQDVSRDNYDRISHVPAFYGARHGAGHTATVYHVGGGEYANVASNWLKYHFKGDAEAGKMFVGPNCTLCTNPNWDTDSKGL